ncbi:hypothetical protein HJ138_23430 [Vibrio parahaemolyticus]|nr:hypothetical protein [Vibrio parahaemolyticus]MBE3977173.1 hypothetical protein [Vibrio parahaemolyticus]
MNYVNLALLVYISYKFVLSLKGESSKSYDEIRDATYNYNLLIYIPFYFGVFGLIYLTNVGDSIQVSDSKLEYSSIISIGSYLVSSMVAIVLIISLISVVLIIRRYDGKKVFWSIVFFSSLSIGVTVFDAIFKLGEFKLYEKNNIEHQEVNLYSQGGGESIERIDEIFELSTIDGFKSGSHSVPDYDWKSLEDKIAALSPKILIVSGFSDPHKIKDDSNVNNTLIARNRAIAVKGKIEKMNVVKLNNLPIFIMSNGINNGVKLFEYQREQYSVERKVKIYVGI